MPTYSFAEILAAAKTAGGAKYQEYLDAGFIPTNPTMRLIFDQSNRIKASDRPHYYSIAV